MVRLSIINRVLVILKQRKAVEEKDTSELAELCYRHYDITKREVLSSANWSCATKMVSSYSSESNLEGYFEHKIPDDFLKVVEVKNCFWKIMGDKLYCNSKNIILTYVHNCSDIYLDTNLRTLITFRLGAELSPIITEDINIHSYLLNLYELNLKNFKFIDKKNQNIGNENLSNENLWHMSRQN